MIRQIPVLLDPTNVKRSVLVTLHFYLQISAKNVLTTISLHFSSVLGVPYNSKVALMSYHSHVTNLTLYWWLKF